MDDKFLKWDPKSKNIISMALWALIQSWQLLIIVALILSFIPFKAHPFAEKLFLLHRNGVQPERGMFFYRMFVVAAVLFLGAALYLFRRRLDEGALTKKILSLTAVDAGWIFIQVFAIFKIFVTDDPEWARYVLYAAMAGAVVTRVFWTEIKEWAPRVYQKLLDGPAVRTLRLALDIAVPAYIILIIYVPDLTKVLARIFVRDQFYHLDSFIMAPGWAQFNGLVLNRDVISEYSVLIPFLVSRMAKVFGGFDYQHVIAVLMVISILYLSAFIFSFVTGFDHH